jgi:hypothetical protein
MDTEFVFGLIFGGCFCLSCVLFNYFATKKEQKHNETNDYNLHRED